MSGEHPYSLVREEVVKFLYKCDVESIFYFPGLLYDTHSLDFSFEKSLREDARKLIEGVMENLHDLDRDITGASKNWTMERMSRTDRSVLRLAAYELQHKKAPRKVVINEAIKLAKRYGSSHSGGFVNGILDAFPH